MLRLGKYSFGMGDRFAHQARAQLQACIQAANDGAEIVPVWNKSNREHLTIGSEPDSVRTAAAEAVRKLKWRGPFHVDADHIRLETVDRFLDSSDFFTLDVADFIGRRPDQNMLQSFVREHRDLEGTLEIRGLPGRLTISKADLEETAAKYLYAAKEAGKIYRHIENQKGGDFITEISMDETDRPQTPKELLMILAAIADEKIPVQTIAPKFTGRFNKGVDYDGDLKKFEQEFNADLAVIAFAIERFQLPDNLKLSVHSGSDKFSIYRPIREALHRFDAGVHLKTAGTTWLEELIGLAEAGGDGLKLAREIYAQALEQREELCAPYAAVISIDPAKLPSKATVQKWSGEQFVKALRHDPKCREFNPHVRQLLHVGYKIAAKMGARYLNLLKQHEKVVAAHVTENLYRRHLVPLFLPGK